MFSRKQRLREIFGEWMRSKIGEEGKRAGWEKGKTAGEVEAERERH